MARKYLSNLISVKPYLQRESLKLIKKKIKNFDTDDGVYSRKKLVYGIKDTIKANFY